VRKRNDTGYLSAYVQYRTRKLMLAEDRRPRAWPFGGKT